MAVTLNNEGKALTETIQGVTMPVDYSFSTVNDFVHSPQTQYEDLEGLCLAMSSHLAEKAKKTKAVITQLAKTVDSKSGIEYSSGLDELFKLINQL